MHKEAYEAIRTAIAGIDLIDLRVVEIGSYDVNGSPRPLFAGCAEYVGVDLRAGRGVDVVCDAVDYGGTDFDIVITAEVLEHVKNPADIIAAAWCALKPGGLLVITAASAPRQPHDIDGYPLTDDREWYKNITVKAMEKLLADWEEAAIFHNPDPGDIYATARKPHENPGIHAATS